METEAADFGFRTEQDDKQGQTKIMEKQNPPLKLSDAEYDYKKKIGLCYKCRERWSKALFCRNKVLQIMVVSQGYEMELVEEEFFEAQEGNESTERIEMSLYSFFGWSLLTTIKIRGKIGKTSVVVLIDSGATHNFISPEVVKKTRLQPSSGCNLTVMVRTGISVNCSGICRRVELQLQSVLVTMDFIVLEPGSADVILGVQLLRTLGKCEVDWQNHELSFMTKLGRVTLKGDVSTEGVLQDQSVECSGMDWNWTTITMFTATSESVSVAPSCVTEVLRKFEDVFAEPTEPPPNRGFEHSIRFWEGTKPISLRPYRYPHLHMVTIEKMVKQILKAGVIRNSRSPYSSPVLLVKKKDGGWRFCVDYRAVNRATIPDKFPSPVIYQLLDELNGAVIFSKLDLRSGYHQIRMVESDIEKTAFKTHDGQYEFVVMPLELSNAPVTFQALMNDIFKPFLRKFVLVCF